MRLCRLVLKTQRCPMYNTQDDYKRRDTHSTCRNNHPRQFRAPRKAPVRESSDRVVRRAARVVEREFPTNNHVTVVTSASVGRNWPRVDSRRHDLAVRRARVVHEARDAAAVRRVDRRPPGRHALVARVLDDGQNVRRPARLELGPLPLQRGLSRDDGARVVDDAPAFRDVLAGDEAPAPFAASHATRTSRGRRARRPRRQQVFAAGRACARTGSPSGKGGCGQRRPPDDRHRPRAPPRLASRRTAATIWRAARSAAREQRATRAASANSRRTATRAPRTGAARRVEVVRHPAPWRRRAASAGGRRASPSVPSLMHFAVARPAELHAPKALCFPLVQMSLSMNAERWRSTAIAARLCLACPLSASRESSQRPVALTAPLGHSTADRALQTTPRAATTAPSTRRKPRTRPKPLGGHTTHNALCTAARDARRPSRPQHHACAAVAVAKLGAGRGLGCSGRGRRARGRGRAAAAVRRGVGGARRPRLIKCGAALRPVEARRRAARGQRRREEQCHLRRVRRRVEINQ